MNTLLKKKFYFNDDFILTISEVTSDETVVIEVDRGMDFPQIIEMNKQELNIFYEWIKELHESFNDNR